jgi:hypothetical protein
VGSNPDHGLEHGIVVGGLARQSKPPHYRFDVNIWLGEIEKTQFLQEVASKCKSEAVDLLT